MTALQTIDAPAALVEELRANHIFNECSTEVLSELAERAVVKEARRGQIVSKSDEMFPYLGFVRQGVLGVDINSEPGSRGVHRLRLYEANAGSTFGEIALLDASVALGEVSVLSKSAMFALIPASDIMRAASSDSRLFARLSAQAAARCRELTRRLLEQHALPVTARVAAFLLPFAPEGETLLRAVPGLDEFIQRDIAAAAGCVKEAAARAIAQLEDAGAIRREHGRIRYVNRSALLRLAKRETNDDRHHPISA